VRANVAPALALVPCVLLKQQTDSAPSAASSSFDINSLSSSMSIMALITVTVLAAFIGYLLQRSRRTADAHTAALRTARDEALLYKNLKQQQEERYIELQAEQEAERMRSAETLFTLSHGAKLSIDESEAAWAQLSRRVLDKHYRKQLQRTSGTSSSSSSSSSRGSSSSGSFAVHKHDVKAWYAALSKQRYAQAKETVQSNFAEYGFTAADAQDAIGADGKYLAEKPFTCQLLLLVKSELGQQLGALQALETALVASGLDSQHMLQLMVDTVYEQAGELVSPWATALTAAAAAAAAAAVVAAAAASSTTALTAVDNSSDGSSSSSSSDSTGDSPQGSLQLSVRSHSVGGISPRWGSTLAPIYERSDSERSASPSPKELASKHAAAAHSRARSLDSAEGVASAAVVAKAAAPAAAAPAAPVDKNAELLAMIAKFASTKEQRTVTPEDILKKFNSKSPKKSVEANGKPNGQPNGPSNGRVNGFVNGHTDSGSAGGTSSAGHTPRLTAEAVARAAAAAAAVADGVESAANSRRGSGASAGSGPHTPKTPKTPKQQFDDMVETVGKHLVRAFGQELTAPPSPPC
jgi:hypothetical protein